MIEKVVEFLNSLFKSGSRKRKEDMSIDELIAEGLYDDAVVRLEKEISSKRHDPTLKIRLAEVKEKLGRINDAVELYLQVGSEYARDGFYDKAIATLQKAVRLDPNNEVVVRKLRSVENMKKLEESRVSAINAFVGKIPEDDPEKANYFIEFQALWPNLAKCPIIKSLRGWQMRILFENMDIVRFDPKKVIFRRGEKREEFHIIASGEVEVGVEDDGNFVVLRMLGPGDVMGDAALFEGKPWPAIYRSTGEQVTTLRMDKAGLATALKGNRDPVEFLRLLRVRQSDNEIAKIVKDFLKE